MCVELRPVPAGAASFTIKTTTITIDEVGKSKHNKTLLRYKESKDRKHVSALLFYKAIIRSDMMN